MKQLKKIKLVKQPKNSLLCGVACIKMVVNHYLNGLLSLDDIWKEISGLQNGKVLGKTYKMGKYLEQRNLDTSIIKFSELRTILEYCREYQIPAIMNIHSFENEAMGHFVLFIGYSGDSVIIRDPNNERRVTVSFNSLKERFITKTDNDDIGGNIIILSSDKIEDKEEYICPNCKHTNIISKTIKSAVMGLVCLNCNKDISIN